jgi:hypothetical protein
MKPAGGSQPELRAGFNYLESRIRHYAGSAGISIDSLTWHRPQDRDVSEFTITIGSKQKAYVLEHTNQDPRKALIQQTKSDLEELAKVIIAGSQ